LTPISEASRVSALETVMAAAAAAPLAVFVESGTGFQTSDLRDAQNQINQFSASGELIWTADGTRLPGYRVKYYTFSDGRRYYFVEGGLRERTTDVVMAGDTRLDIELTAVISP
jgi:hypothetical protein